MPANIKDVPRYSRDMFRAFYEKEFQAEEIQITAQGLLAIETTANQLDLEKTKIDPELGTLFLAMNHETSLWTKTIEEAIAEFRTANQLESDFGDPLSYAAVVAAHRLVTRLNYVDAIRHSVSAKTKNELDGYLEHLEELFIAEMGRLAYLKRERELLLQEKRKIASTAIETESLSDSNTTSSLQAINKEIEKIDQEILVAENNVLAIKNQGYESNGLTQVVQNNASTPATQRKINLSRVQGVAA